MKKQNIIILIVLLVIIAISFVLLSAVFHNSLCDTLKSIIESILTSSIIALPGYSLLIYHSYQKANQSISDLLLKIYWVLQTKLTTSAGYEATKLKEIIEMLTNASIRIGQIREDSFVKKKYNHDALTAQIKDLNSACQAYLSSPENQRDKDSQQIIICKAKIINTICKIENFVQNENNTIEKPTSNAP